jgi:hypothetical protein
MKSPLYITALFVLGLGLTGCGDSLTSPADNLDSQDASSYMGKVLERNRMPIGTTTSDDGKDTSTTDSAVTDSTTAIQNPLSPTSLDGSSSKN